MASALVIRAGPLKINLENLDQFTLWGQASRIHERATPSRDEHSFNAGVSRSRIDDAGGRGAH